MWSKFAVKGLVAKLRRIGLEFGAANQLNVEISPVDLS
jgi:hypothetical protein